MLGQALDAADAAAAAEAERQEEASRHATEEAALQTTSPTLYGATTTLSNSAPTQSHTDDEYEDDDDDEDDYLLEGEWREREDPDESSSVAKRAWKMLKNLIVVIANVENLYDHTPNSSVPDLPNATTTRRRRNLIVFFWFVALASSYATERSTFKLLVDHTGPFRLFSVQMVTAMHASMLSAGLLFSCLSVRQAQRSQASRNATTSSTSTTPTSLGLGISIVDVGLMALMDSVSLILAFLSGVHVPPTLTVILVQFTLPLTAFLTQFVHPDGRFKACCPSNTQSDVAIDAEISNSPPAGSNHSMDRTPSPSNAQSMRDSPYDRSNDLPPGYHASNGFDDDHDNGHIDERTNELAHVTPEEGRPLPRWGGLSAEHIWGSVVILIAVLLALVPAFVAIADPLFFLYADTIPVRTAYNTILYVCSCIPAAASQLYKEHVFLQYKQPVNMTYLNILLSVFQFLYALIISPLIFELQGLGAKSGKKDWTNLYPSSKFNDNFKDGLRCFFGGLSHDDQENKYFDSARCDFALGLVIFHALSIIVVGVAVDKIVNAGATKVLYRGMSAGIIVAVLCMHAYDMSISEYNYGPAIDGLNLACLILLILGSEIYHRVGLKESTFETVYPVVQTYYDDDNR